MRIAPRPVVSVLALVAYAATMALLWVLTGTQYDTIPDSTANLLRGVVLTVGAAALVMAVLTTWLGWWRPAIREERVVAPKWTLVVPVIFALLAALNIASIDFGKVGPSFLVTLLIGVLFVGFGEELTTRGVGLVGMRGRFSEVGSWLLTSLLFGLLHSLNLFFGQPVPATIQQIVIAALSASALYLARMSTGTLVTAMLLHAMWDFGGLGVNGSDATGSALVAVAGIVNWPFLILAVAAAFVVARRVDRAKEDVAESAAAA